MKGSPYLWPKGVGSREPAFSFFPVSSTCARNRWGGPPGPVSGADPPSVLGYGWGTGGGSTPRVTPASRGGGMSPVFHCFPSSILRDTPYPQAGPAALEFSPLEFQDLGFQMCSRASLSFPAAPQMSPMRDRRRASTSSKTWIEGSRSMSRGVAGGSLARRVRGPRSPPELSCPFPVHLELGSRREGLSRPWAVSFPEEGVPDEPEARGSGGISKPPTDAPIGPGSGVFLYSGFGRSTPKGKEIGL